MNSMFTIWVLYTYRLVDSLPVCDAYGYTDQAAAQAAGEAMTKNPDLPGLTFMVLALQEASA
jgi:hypothetical protein